MKIVLVHNAYQQVGGEDVVFESERRLLESAGHHVIPYVRSNWQLRNTTLVDRIAIVPRMVWSSETRREFGALLDTNSPKLVHVHNTFMAISPSIYSACEERGIPVVQTLHNYRLLCPGSNFYRDGKICEECLEHGLHRSIRHGCYRHSRSATAGVALMLAVHNYLRTWSTHVTRFITLTEFARRKFVAAGFPREKFVVKPNFVDPDPGERVSHGDYAVFVGRLATDKGLLVLLDAWSQLQRQYPLQIVGDGPARESLEAQVRERQLSNITFRGRLSRSDAMATIKNSRFLIVPSTWYETFGMCIAESFACGTPVLCSRLGAMEEIVTDGHTGLHFTPNNALDLASKVDWLWNHPREGATMGRAARAKYESSYTAEHNHTLLMRIYEQALGQPTWQSRRVTTLQPSIPTH
jgi:glycosyltransferase involved in cell wall biosynthesis